MLGCPFKVKELEGFGKSCILLAPVAKGNGTLPVDGQGCNPNNTPHKPTNTHPSTHSYMLYTTSIASYEIKDVEYL